MAARAVEPRFREVGSDAAHEALDALGKLDGRVHFAGDYMTDMSSWMQEAFESAREVAMAIHERARVRG